MAFFKKLWPKVRRRLPALGVLALAVFLVWAAFGKSFRSLLPLIRAGDQDAIVTYLSGEDAIMGMVSVAFMVPGVPNGIVPYIAARTGLTQKQYFIGTAIGSWMQILASCMAGSFLIRGNIMFSVIAIFIQWAALAAVIWKRDWLMQWFFTPSERTPSERT